MLLTALHSEASCRNANARAVAVVSPVTYRLGHDSPLPTVPSEPTASIQTVSVAVRSAEACRNAVLNGMSSLRNSKRSIERSADHIRGK